jgi:hypothetical protein
VFKEFGIELQDAWPLVSGETPMSMPVGPGTPEYRCRPALTMHHLTPGDMRELAEFEQSRMGNLVRDRASPNSEASARAPDQLTLHSRNR